VPGYLCSFFANHIREHAMAPDDRDPLFEKALERHLHCGAPQPDCLDAETLAAYHERLLAPEQMTACKQHITSCARCGAIMLQLETTDDLMLESDQQAHDSRNVLTMPSPESSEPNPEPGPQLVPELAPDLPELVHALPESAPPTPASLPSRAARVAQSGWRSKTLHGANWRWLAPAGVLAAALLIWVSFHETLPTEFQLAKNSQPLPPLPSSTSPSQPASPDIARPTEREGSLRKESADLSSNGRATRSADAATPQGAARLSESEKNESGKLGNYAALDKKTSQPAESGQLSASRISPAPSSSAIARAAAQPPSSRSDLDASIHPQDEIRSRDDVTRKQIPPVLSVPNVVRQKDQSAEKDDSVNPIAANAPSPQLEVSAKPKATSGATQASPQAAKSEVVSSAAELQRAPVMSMEAKSRPGASNIVAVASAATPSTFTIVTPAPGSATLWRFAPAGIIQHSSDAGSTWSLQPSNVVSDLLAGSATSPKVCWIVGRDSTILRTADAGHHWTKIPSPVIADITSVFAVSAKQATITTSTHETYTTTNAGQTWTQIPTHN
jgi:Photosynthesis system II assembly factor YCF48